MERSLDVYVEVIDPEFIPFYAKEGDAGFDLRANIKSPYTLDPGERMIVPVGLKTSFAKGFEIQVRPRSGLAAKYGISVVNAPGTIDSGFRNEIGVILINLGKESFVINRGDRIAQGVLTRYTTASFNVVDDIHNVEYEGSAEDRQSGFGGTGVN